MVEGVRLCREALVSEFKIETAFLNKDFQKDTHWNEFNKFFEKRQIPFTVLKNSSFKKLADTKHPQGVLLICHQPQFELNTLNPSDIPFLVLLDGIRDPGNFGTIIRSADWFDAGAVILSKDCVDPYNPKVIRSTMGSIFHLPIVEVDNLKDLLIGLREKNFYVIATSASASKSIETVQFTKPVALILGGEAEGISPDLISEANILVKIPKFGKAESLNVAQAGAIISHYIANRVFDKSRTGIRHG